MIASSHRRQTIERATRAGFVRVVRMASFVACLLLTATFNAVTFEARAQEPADSTSVPLSSEERSWLANHQPIRLGLYKGGWAPFDLLDRTGRHQGISADYLALGRASASASWSSRSSIPTGIRRSRRRSASRSTCWFRWAARRSAKAFLAFSKPYITSSNVVVARRSNSAIRSLEISRGTTVAVEKGYAPSTMCCRCEVPGVNIVNVADTEAALRAVASGRADAYVGDLIVSTFLINRLNLANLDLRGEAGFSTSQLHFAVRKDWPRACRAARPRDRDDQRCRTGRAIRDRWLPRVADHRLGRDRPAKYWPIPLARRAAARLGGGLQPAPAARSGGAAEGRARRRAPSRRAAGDHGLRAGADLPEGPRGPVSLRQQALECRLRLHGRRRRRQDRPRAFPAVSAEEIVASDKYVLESGQVRVAEEQLPLVDGMHTAINTMFPLMDEIGKAYAVCGFCTDITEAQARGREVPHDLRQHARCLLPVRPLRASLDCNAAALRLFGMPSTARRCCRDPPGHPRIRTPTYPAGRRRLRPVLHEDDRWTRLVRERQAGQLRLAAIANGTAASRSPAKSC